MQSSDESVSEELLAREPIFHRPEHGTQLEDYLGMTDPEFWEVGASGRAYDRENVIAALLARGKIEGDEQWRVTEHRCRRLSDDVFALTYVLDRAGRCSRRLSIWQRSTSGWRVIYHQGTLVA